MSSTGRAGIRVAVGALAAVAAILGCSNPLINMVKDVALKNTASLSSLTVSAGGSDLKLSPAFSSSILAYRTLTSRSITAVTVKAAAADVAASVTVNGSAPGTTGVPVTLVQDGATDVTIDVASASGLQKTTYTVRIASGIIRQLTGGEWVNVALCGDGTVWTWGAGGATLGDGTYTGRSLPAWVSGISEIQSISLTFNHVLAIKEDGTVWAWGGNWGGQLGDGTTRDRDVPGQVYSPDGSGNLTEIKAVAAGWDHSLALKNDGTVFAWGANYGGALGDLTFTNRALPVRVLGGMTTVDAIAAGSGFSLALKHDGTVWAWGVNWNGELGNGSTGAGSYTPAQVSGLSGVKAIAAGANYGLALLTDGTLMAWGGNGDGQLGLGTTTDQLTPVAIASFSGVASIAATWTHSVALKSDGNVYTWGSNWRGEQGDGTITFRTSPHLVNLPLAMAVGLSGQGVLVLTQDDHVYWWGSSYYEPSAIFTTPVQVQGITGTATKVSAGAGHSVALVGTAVWTWGDNYVGELGYAQDTDQATAKSTAVSGVSVVSAGYMHNLALVGTAVWAWGYNSDGQLGDGSTTDRTTPLAVSGLPSVSLIAAGFYHSLAAGSAGEIYAWGRNNFGQLGDGTQTNRNTPATVSGGLGIISALAAGENHSLAVVSSGAVWAWGQNSAGELGDGTTTDSKTPVAATVLTSGVSAVAAGSQFSLALKTVEKTVWSWGANWTGQLGNGTWANSSSPGAVSLQGSYTAIAAGTSHALALNSDKTVWAWGSNAYGQLGNGTVLSSNIPVQVSGLTGVTAIAAGGAFSLAVKSDGTVWAWGSGESGQLGNGVIAFQFTPVVLAWP